jgi:hypothetical protein
MKSVSLFVILGIIVLTLITFKEPVEWFMFRVEGQIDDTIFCIGYVPPGRIGKNSKPLELYGQQLRVLYKPYKLKKGKVRVIINGY